MSVHARRDDGKSGAKCGYNGDVIRIALDPEKVTCEACGGTPAPPRTRGYTYDDLYGREADMEASRYEKEVLHR